MFSQLFPFIYGFIALLLLFLAGRVMLRGWFLDQTVRIDKPLSNQSSDDRTGRVTIHPELLNKEGRITDEDLLTVRFSRDIDPPQSKEKPSD